MKKKMKQILSVMLALVLLLTGISIPQKVKADVREMELDEDGNITWTTVSKVGTSDKRFKTIGWNITIQEKKNGKYGNTKHFKYVDDNFKNLTKDGVNDAVMHYKVTDLKEKYDEGEYRIIANAIVEFYYSSNNKHYATATNKADADRIAHRFFGNSNSYFDTYFNREVKISAFCLTAKCDNGLKSSTIKIDGKKEKNNKKWMKKNDKAKLNVDAKDGYMFKSADNAKMKLDGNTRNGDGASNPIQKNMTVMMHSQPVKMKVNYYVDDQPIGNQTFEFDYNKKEQALGGYDSTGKMNLDFSGIILKNDRWYTNPDCEGGDSYTKNQYVDNKKMIWKWWNADKDDTTQTHTINLYGKTEGTKFYREDGYTIIYKGNGATSGNMDPQGCAYGRTTMLTPIKFKRTGYTYKKTDTWKSQKKAKTYKDGAKVSDATLDFDDSKKKTVTLYAQWKPNKNYIQYNGNGATSGTVGNTTVTYDNWTSKVAKNNFVKNGKSPSTLWNTKPDGSGYSIAENTIITKDIYKKLFGENTNEKTITLYAIWDGSVKADPEIKEIGNGTITYKSGENYTNEIYGPEGYEKNGYYTMQDCMFGDKQEKDNTKVYRYPTHVYSDDFESQDYLMRAGTSVLQMSDTGGKDHYYTFMGWSTDKNAVYSKSKSVIWNEKQQVSGDDLTYRYYGYLHPVKANPAWNSSELSCPVSKPIPVLLSSDASTRASQILESQNAWKRYTEVLNAEYAKQTQIRDKEKREYEEWKAKEESYRSILNSLTPPSYPGPDASKEALDSYESSLSSYWSSVSYYSGLVNNARAKKEEHYNKMKEAQTTPENPTPTPDPTPNPTPDPVDPTPDPTPNPDVPDVSDNPENPDLPEDPDNPADSDSPDTPTDDITVDLPKDNLDISDDTEKQTEAPKTGDTKTVTYIMLMFASLIGLAYACKKKKKC